MNSTLISVVMPVYNSEKYVASAIDSILNQTCVDFELLIFDDGSTDKSWEIISQYAKIDKRIVPFRSETNSGYVVHLNNGVMRAVGDFIARMDSDDIALPDRLALQLDFLRSNPNVGVVGTSSIQIDERGRELRVSLRNDASKALLWQSFFTNPLAHPTVMFRKSVVVGAGLYDARKIPSEDYDLWVRVLRVSLLANLQTPLLKYRQHPNSVSLIKAESQAAHALQTLKEHWRYFCKADISTECAFFFRNFHKGFEVQSLSVIRSSYFLIIRLYIAVLKRQGVVRYVEADAFNKLVYLTLRAGRYSIVTFLQFSALLAFVFPFRSARKLLMR